MTMLKSLLAFSIVAEIATGLSTVVYGPQSRELLLLTSKNAAFAGIDTSFICAPGNEEGCRRLMYGEAYAEAAVDEAGKARPISGGEDMQDALEKADCLVVACHDQPMDQSAVKTLVEVAGENLSKLVLISKMGVTKAKGGFFGGDDKKLLESEEFLRSMAKSKDIDLAVVRGGILKGGGPGANKDEYLPDNDFSLSKTYYNTRLDIVEAMVTMSHDKYTVGVECVKGDPLELPNMMKQMGTKSSFDPSPTDTSRIALASAAVAAILAETPSLEFSVSSAKGSAPPSMEEWKEIIGSL